MYIFLIVLIVLASLLMILAVLVQNPKSGMAANFGASNQVMGVRQTTNFLERFTWSTAIFIVVLSVLTTMMIPSANIQESKSALQQTLEQSNTEVQPFAVPATTQPEATTPAEQPKSEEATK